MLSPAPPGFQTDVVFDAEALGPILADRTDADGRKVIIADTSGELHVWLQHPDAAARPAVLLPSDSVFELRLDIASRLIRRLRGSRINLLPSALRLTPFKKTRLIQLLHAFDIHDDGGEPRDVAAEVLGSKQADLPAIEFKDSAARKRAARLIKDSIALVNCGYLKLLRGD